MVPFKMEINKFSTSTRFIVKKHNFIQLKKDTSEPRDSQQREASWAELLFDFFYAVL